MMYVSAPLRAGDEEKNECSRAETVPKEAGVPSCLKRKVVSFGTDFTATVGCRHPNLSVRLFSGFTH